MTDIKWRTPAKVYKFLKKYPSIVVIFLVKEKDDSYITILVYQENGASWVDSPLGDFSSKKFNPYNYLQLAIIAYQLEGVNHEL
jgi:hypothetical protein